MFVRVGDAVVTAHNLMAAGVDYAVSMGADVIAIANGAYNYSGMAHESFIAAHEAGTFIVAASGDELGFHHIYPAAGEDVFSVKAVLPFAPIELFRFDRPADLIAFTESYCTNYGPAINVSISSDQCTSTATGPRGRVRRLNDLLGARARYRVDADRDQDAVQHDRRRH